MRKIGINVNSYGGLDPREDAAYIKAAGFSGVFSGFQGRDAVLTIAEALAGAGLDYETVHAPFRGINAIWLPGEEGDAMLETLSSCVKACGEAGVPATIIHLSSGNTPPPVTDLGRARFDALIACAADAGVVLAFENQRKLSNLAWVFETYPDHPNVRFCWDCGHEHCFTPGMHFMPYFAPWLTALHLHDNLGYGTGVANDLHLFPFAGTLDFDFVARQIAAAPFRGTLMLEVSRRKLPEFADYTPEAYYAAAAAAATRLAEMVARVSAPEEA